MAVQISYTDSRGHVSTSAYVRISRVNGDKDTMCYSVDIYKSNSDYTGGKDVIASEHYKKSSHQGSDLWPQLYVHLKTQPGYESAVDV